MRHLYAPGLSRPVTRPWQVRAFGALERRSRKKASTSSTARCCRWAVSVEWPLPGQLDPPERRSQLTVQPVEAGAGRRVAGVAQPEHRAAVRRPGLDRGQVGGGEVEVVGASPADREGQRRLGDHRRRDAGIDHHGQREPAGEAHAQRAHSDATELAVQLSGQRPQPGRHR